MRVHHSAELAGASHLQADGEEGIFYADISSDRVADVKRQLPIESGRRHDLYNVSFTPDAH